MRPSRRKILAATAGAAALSSFAKPFIRPALANTPVRVAVLADMNGPYATLSGISAVSAAKLAVEDFKAMNPTLPAEVVYADFQLKPDVGLAISRKWFDTEGVDAVADIPMSALALGLTTMVKEKNKVGLFSGTATEDLTSKYCGPNHVHWTYDSYAMATTVAEALLRRKLDTWFFIAADYAMGASVVRDATGIITAAGGKVLGSVRHPFPSTGDFSSLLLQAQGSGAKVICFANAGDDLATCIKQAAEFRVTSGGAVLTAMLMDVPTVHAIGLKDSQGMFYSNAFYWAMNDGARKFTDRMLPLTNGIRPCQNVAGTYSATLHYLKAAAAVGQETAKTNGAAVVAKMKEMQVTDPLYGPAVIRANGRLMNKMYLFQVKQPSQSTGEWDYVQAVETVEPEKAFRPMTQASCAMAAAQ